MLRKYIQQQHQQQQGVLLDLTAIAAGKDFRSRIWESLQERLEWRWRGVLEKYFPNQSSEAAKNSKKVREEILAATPTFLYIRWQQDQQQQHSNSSNSSKKNSNKKGGFALRIFLLIFLIKILVYEWQKKPNSWMVQM